MDLLPRHRRLLRLDAIAGAPDWLRHRVVLSAPSNVAASALERAARDVFATDSCLRARILGADGDARWDVADAALPVPVAARDGAVAGARLASPSALLLEVHGLLFDRRVAARLAARIAARCATGSAGSAESLATLIGREAEFDEQLVGVPALDAASPLQLTALRGRREPTSATVAGAERFAAVDLLGRIEAACRGSGIGPNAWAEAAVHVLLARCSGHPAGYVERVERLPACGSCDSREIGMLEIVDAAGWPPFVEIARRIERRRTFRRGPTVDAIAVIPRARESWQHPAISYTIDLAPDPPIVLPEGWRVEAAEDQYVEDELRLSMRCVDNAIRIAAVARADLFDVAYLAGLCGALEAILLDTLAQPTRSTAAVSTVAGREAGSACRGPQAAWPRESLDQAFATAATTHASRAALLTSQGPIAYDALRRDASRWAESLRRVPIGVEEPVVVCMARGPGVVAPILGVLEANGAYVPLDPAWPPGRLEALIDDCRARVIITDRSAPIRDRPGRTLLDAPLPAGGDPTASPSPSHDARHAAYVLYTSGSTGSPKGAIGHHGATLNRLRWMWSAFPFAVDDVMVQKAPLAFGDAIWELFGGLLHGVPTLHVTDDELHDLPTFVELLDRHAVTRLVVVPALLRTLLTENPRGLDRVLGRLRIVVTSGETVAPELAERFLSRSPAMLLNLYGSIETAADATWHCVRRGATSCRVPIGGPIANAEVHVLDGNLERLPAGVPGQLYVAGKLLARGYLHRPRETAARFLPCPGGAPGVRMFRTGDLVRWTPSSGLEFLGRMDHQVKVRGMRVELGEVETALQAIDEVGDAAVVCADAGADRARLVAFVEPRGAPPPAPADLLARLANRLPAFMLPGRIVVDALPRTATDKVDRQALRRRAEETPALEQSDQPEGELEATLSGLMADVLGCGAIGRFDDFFERGGDSLAAMRIASRIVGAIGVDIRARDVLEQRTVAALAKHLTESGAPRQPPASVDRGREPGTLATANLEAIVEAIERRRGASA